MSGLGEMVAEVFGALFGSPPAPPPGGTWRIWADDPQGTTCLRRGRLFSRFIEAKVLWGVGGEELQEVFEVVGVQLVVLWVPVSGEGVGGHLGRVEV